MSAASERPGPAGRTRLTVPEVVWNPLVVGGMLALVGVIGLAAGQPWLFPSLGPTAFLQAEEPVKPASRFYNTVVGHLVGFASGVLSVLLLGAPAAPSVLASKELAPVRVWAAALSGILTMIGLSSLKASHPPAAATMLLVALGGFEPTWRMQGSSLPACSSSRRWARPPDTSGSVSSPPHHRSGGGGKDDGAAQ